MSKRLIKQLIYGFFYLLVLTLLGVGLYFGFLRPEPSCTNNRLDPGEQDVDCGGVCAKVCIPLDFKPLGIEAPKIFSPAPGKAAILTQVRNRNPRLAARTFSYTLEVKDAKGKVVKTISEKSFAYAGEVKYLFSFLEDISPSTTLKATVTAEEPEWVQEDSFKKPSLSIAERHAGQNGEMFSMAGTLANSDTVTFPMVTVLALFKDAQSKVLSISATELEGLSPGESRPFAVFHPRVQGLDIERTELVIVARRP